jgi:hypothetical protein
LRSNKGNRSAIKPTTSLNLLVEICDQYQDPTTLYSEEIPPTTHWTWDPRASLHEVEEISLVWFVLVYLFIHSVTHVTMDTLITDYNLYITTQLRYILLSLSGIILWLSDHPTCIQISRKTLPFDSRAFKTVKFIITHTSKPDLDINIWTTI